MIKRKRKINKQRTLANIDMLLQRWVDHPVYQELRNKYGTLMALAMMDDASKCEYFAESATRHTAIVRWSDTNYVDNWRRLAL